MNFFERFLDKYSEHIYALARIAIAILFLSHGIQKLFGGMGGHQASSAKFIAAGIIEFFGGIMIGSGFKVRYAAFVAAGEMAVAYFTVHAFRALWPIQNGGEMAVFYCFFFLYAASKGSGIWSVDSLLSKNTR